LFQPTSAVIDEWSDCGSALLQAARSLNSSSGKRPPDELRTALISVCSSASVRCSSRLLFPSITHLQHFLPRLSRQKIIRFQKTPLRFDVNGLRAAQRLSVDAAQQNGRSVYCVAPRPHRSKKSSVEFLRLGDYVLRTRPQRRLEAATPGIRWCNKNKNTRENDYGNGRQTNAHLIQRDSQAHP
jgi:hypothetical protein